MASIIGSDQNSLFREPSLVQMHLQGVLLSSVKRPKASVCNLSSHNFPRSQIPNGCDLIKIKEFICTFLVY